MINSVLSENWSPLLNIVAIKVKENQENRIETHIPCLFRCVSVAIKMSLVFIFIIWNIIAWKRKSTMPWWFCLRVFSCLFTYEKHSTHNNEKWSIYSIYTRNVVWKKFARKHRDMLHIVEFTVLAMNELEIKRHFPFLICNRYSYELSCRSGRIYFSFKKYNFMRRRRRLQRWRFCFIVYLRCYWLSLSPLYLILTASIVIHTKNPEQRNN